MIITLIGMSNIGKSYLAARLAAEEGFEMIACDSLIEAAMADELKHLGFSGINDVGRWMGQPYTANYAANSAKYIKCEREIMLQIIEHLKHSKATQPIVIDTTGSVIYTGDDIAETLRKLTKIVYLEVPEEHRRKLFEQYLKEPKPVIWGDSYSRQPGESEYDSLARCYPNLLTFRENGFRKIAHSSIPYESHRGKALDLKSFVSSLA